MGDMQPPLRIPIAREEDYHTHYIGTRHEGGSFMGFVTAEFSGPVDDHNWMSRKVWFSVVHIFDENGRHVSSDIDSHGTTADGEEEVIDAARSALAEKLAGLGEVTFGDIAVQRFRVDHEGFTFGLLTAEERGLFDAEEDDPEMACYVHLVPNDLVFYPPWTGEYDT